MYHIYLPDDPIEPEQPANKDYVDTRIAGVVTTPGPPGADSYVPGPPGDDGTNGTNGTNGAAGADSTVPGPTGPTGPTGAGGATGAKGDTGETGASGEGAALDGWVASGQTWTYESAAAPNYLFSEPIDATGKYSPGMRIKCTQGASTKYGIIVAVGAYSGGKTIVTVYCGTDYTLGATITAPFYSTVKAPLGFPLDPAKWTVTGGNSTSYTQATPTQNTWYNALSVAFPIGVWKGFYKCVLSAQMAASTQAEAETTLSTANNSESNAAFSTWEFIQGATGTIRLGRTVYVPIDLALTAAATYYLNYRTTVATMGATGIRGDLKPTTISAVSAYL